jgi:tetratricopeptide (TPR) repeat protein
MRGLVAGLVSLVLAGVPSPAAAQDDAEERARAHFLAGAQAFDHGDYARAADEYQLAYDLSHHPDLLFNLHAANERLGRFDEAADALEGYLRDGELDAERREALGARLENLRARASEQRRQQEEAAAAAEAEARAREEEAARRAGGVHPAGIGVLVAAGVLVASFVVFAALSEMEDGALDARCGTRCMPSEVGTLQAFNIVADVSWITAAVAGATGLVLVLALPPETAAAPTATAFRLLPWAGPGGAGLAAGASF